MKKIPLYLVCISALIIIINSFVSGKPSRESQENEPAAAYPEIETATTVSQKVETAVAEWEDVSFPESDPTYTAAQVVSGFCTDTVFWALDSNGVLTISGNGAIPDFEKDAGNQPWIGYWKAVTALVVEDGITRIGNRAFQSFRYLESAVIGQDVTAIGEWAFQNCAALTYIELPPFVKLETGAFRSTPVEWDFCGTASEAYASSSYYAALCQVSLTGNYREDIINIALSQVGYHEGNSEQDFGGNSDGSNDYTEYGKCLESVGTAWCSEFASWCIRNAGVPTSMIANSRAANVARFTAYTSADYYTWDITVFGGGNYVPRKGDLLLWAWDGNMHGAEENLSHTSILWEAQDLGNGNILLKTVDGNSNNQVRIREYEVSAADGQLVNRTGMLCYFIAPHYEG